MRQQFKVGWLQNTLLGQNLSDFNCPVSDAAIVQILLHTGTISKNYVLMLSNCL